MKKKISRFIAMKRAVCYTFTGVFIVLIAGSCSKSGSGSDDSNPHIFNASDVTAPEISIFTPANGQVFSSGSTINITGRIIDDYGLYRGTIKVSNDASGVMMLDQAYEIHGLKLYNFNINYSASVAAATDYTVTISFEDHGTNSTTKTVKVRINP